MALFKNPITVLKDSYALAENILTSFKELDENDNINNLQEIIIKRINECGTISIPEPKNEKTFSTFSKEFIKSRNNEYERNLCIAYNVIALLKNIIRTYDGKTLVRYYAGFTLEKIAESKAPYINELLKNIDLIIAILDEKKTALKLGEIKLAIHDDETNIFLKELIKFIDPLQNDLIKLLDKKNEDDKYSYSGVRKLLGDMKKEEIVEFTEMDLQNDYDEVSEEAKVNILKSIAAKRFIELNKIILLDKTRKYEDYLRFKEILENEETNNDIDDPSSFDEKTKDVTDLPINDQLSIDELNERIATATKLIKQINIKRKKVKDFDTIISALSLPTDADDNFFDFYTNKQILLKTQLFQSLKILDNHQTNLTNKIEKINQQISHQSKINSYHADLSEGEQSISLLNDDLALTTTKIKDETEKERANEQQIDSFKKYLSSMETAANNCLAQIKVIAKEIDEQSEQKNKLLRAIQSYEEPLQLSETAYSINVQTLKDKRQKIDAARQLLDGPLSDDILPLAIETAIEYNIGDLDALLAKKEQLTNQKHSWSSWTWGKIRSWTVGDKTFIDDLQSKLLNKVQVFDEIIEQEMARTKLENRNKTELEKYRTELESVNNKSQTLNNEQTTEQSALDQLKSEISEIQQKISGLSLNNKINSTQDQTVALSRTNKPTQAIHLSLFARRLQRMFPLLNMNFISLARKLTQIPNINDHTKTDSLSTFRKKIINNKEQITALPSEELDTSINQDHTSIDLIDFYDQLSLINKNTSLSTKIKRQQVKKLLHSTHAKHNIPINTMLRITIANDPLCRYLPLLKDKQLNVHLNPDDYQKILSILDFKISRNNRHINTLKGKPKNRSQEITTAKESHLIRKITHFLKPRKALKKRYKIRKYRILNRRLHTTGINLLKRYIPETRHFLAIESDDDKFTEVDAHLTHQTKSQNERKQKNVMAQNA